VLVVKPSRWSHAEGVDIREPYLYRHFEYREIGEGGVEYFDSRTHEIARFSTSAFGIGPLL
jgi:hypothetical protein